MESSLTVLGRVLSNIDNIEAEQSNIDQSLDNCSEATNNHRRPKTAVRSLGHDRSQLSQLSVH